MKTGCHKEYTKQKGNRSDILTDRNTKKVFLFSNRKHTINPKMALNHTSVYFNKSKTRGRSPYDITEDDIPDENVDKRSLCRVRSKILQRESITGNLMSYVPSSGYATNIADRKGSIQFKQNMKYNSVTNSSLNPLYKSNKVIDQLKSSQISPVK